MSLFLVERPDRGWVPPAVSLRLQFDWRMLERLERQLPVAEAIMLQTFRDRLALLQGVMKALPVPFGIFEQNVFDPMPVFGGPNGVKMAHDVMADGHDTGLLRGAPKV